MSIQIATNHFRWLNSQLQQLWVFDEDDAFVLELHDLVTPDYEIFRSTATHTAGEWIANRTHEWRPVVVKQP